MNIINTIIEYIRIILILLNQYSNLGLLIVAVISFFYVRKEYFLKRRPFVDIEIIPEITEERWGFWIMLINKGTFPGIARISKAILIIGDETYPTIFDTETVLVPEEKKKLFDIGHINKKGLDKIRGHEYRNNRAEIIVQCQAKAIGDKNFLYETHYKYEINVQGEKPVIRIISESLK
ncbi:MAG: hypothetical protein ABSD46_10200 [Bacteroidota bacterium]